jgi:amino acid adenylation domain-containing protein
MTNLLHTRLSPSVGNSDNSALACAAEAVAEGSETARLGDELLRRLSADRRSSTASISLAEAAYKITGDRMDRLFQACAALAVGWDALFLTVFATLLARLAGQEAVTLRNCSGDPAILSLAFDAEASFRRLLSSTHNAHACASDQPCAVEFVVAPSLVSFADIPDHGLRMAVYVTDSETHVRLASSTGLWDQSVLRLWLRYFDHLVSAAVAAPDIPWKTLPFIDAHEFYRAFNDTAAAYPADACVHELVIRRVEQTPDALAIASESQHLTYRELHERSDAIARQLQALGAGPGRPVAVCMGRTAELPVALLGVLKSGSCYVPLDPQESRQRLMTILEECRPAALIVDRSFSALRGSDTIPLVFPDDISESSLVLDYRASGLTPDHLAYMIYTSGTTGKPKGVMIPHRALANLLHSMMREPGFTSFDRILGVTPVSFDIATMEMFLPLVAGGTLVVADRLISADPLRLAAMLERFEITVLQATPVTWRLLASSGWEGKRHLKMICGGEALPRDLANQLLCLGGELWNCYGPTETTIWSGALRIQSEPGVVTVGPPIANTTFYVLDDVGRLLPPGVPGELYIGGIGVSPGYVDRPEITGQRFLPDPYAPEPGARMFKTGDLVRLVNTNEFEFFGRLDHQVKLRGYRIELGEIESVLRTFPGIENAVAALWNSGPGEPYLVAYVTVSHEKTHQPDLRRVRDGLAELLPSYMVPNRFVVMEAMPLTSSGKIDRKALPAPDSVAAILPAYHQPEEATPQTELEEKLLTIFRDVLNTSEFGVTDSFFDYGGYSLLTVKLFTRINHALGLSLPISLVFDAPTVRALAEIIDRDQSLSTIVPICPRGTSAPLFVIHSYLLYGVLPRMVEPDRPIYGVRELLDVEAHTVVERAAIYVKEILRVCPDGPVLLAGWCAAASLTVEIARQLRALEHPVGLVALFDGERPGYRPVVRGYWYFRLMASLKFHFRRLRGEYRRKKLIYFHTVLRRFWDSMVESLFMHNRTLVLRLQRLFGFPLPDAVFNNTWARVTAIQNYEPARYPGKVWLFRALDVPRLPESDETLGWKEIVDGGVEVVFVGGDHESMFHDPNVDLLSLRLRQALQPGA